MLAGCLAACTSQTNSPSTVQKRVAVEQRIQSVTIGLAVRNVTEAATWYKSLLGDVETMEPAPGTLELKLTADTWLQLDDTGYLTLGGGSAVVRLQTHDIVGEHARVKRLTTDVEEIVIVEGVVTYFDFKDPSGNRLSFVQLL
jgi:catechol 2,3-dioxygenase-like lactoylglutathione lyase family enzyme